MSVFVAIKGFIVLAGAPWCVHFYFDNHHHNPWQSLYILFRSFRTESSRWWERWSTRSTYIFNPFYSERSTQMCERSRFCQGVVSLYDGYVNIMANFNSRKTLINEIAITIRFGMRILIILLIVCVCMKRALLFVDAKGVVWQIKPWMPHDCGVDERCIGIRIV